MSIYVLLGQRDYTCSPAQEFSVCRFSCWHGSMVAHTLGAEKRLCPLRSLFLSWAMGSPSTVTQKLSEQP